MGTEIERKWKIDPKVRLHLSSLGFVEGKFISQVYICLKPEIRLRDSSILNFDPAPDHECTITIKSQPSSSSLTREEHIIKIDKDEYDAVANGFNIIGNVTHKVRYRHFANPLITLDIFQGALDGLILVEREFSSEQDARDFSIEEEWKVMETFVEKEVSEDLNYYGSRLCLCNSVEDIEVKEFPRPGAN